MNAKGIRESNPRFLKTAQRMTFKKKKKQKTKKQSKTKKHRKSGEMVQKTENSVSIPKNCLHSYMVLLSPFVNTTE